MARLCRRITLYLEETGNRATRNLRTFLPDYTVSPQFVKPRIFTCLRISKSNLLTDSRFFIQIVGIICQSILRCFSISDVSGSASWPEPVFTCTTFGLLVEMVSASWIWGWRTDCEKVEGGLGCVNVATNLCGGEGCLSGQTRLVHRGMASTLFLERPDITDSVTCTDVDQC